MLITNAKIITMDKQDYDNGYILINDNKIADVGDMKNVPYSDDVFDAKGKFAVPAFIDAHCHLGLFGDGEGYGGEDANEKFEPILPQLKVSDAVNTFDRCFNEAFEAGVLNAAVSPGSYAVIGGQVAVYNTYSGKVIKDCVAVKAAFGENTKHNDSPATRMGAASMIRQALIDARENEGFKYEALKKVLNREIPIHAHAHRASDILTAIKIAEEFDIDVKIIHATEGYKIADTLKSKNIDVMVGPLICDRGKDELKDYDDKNPAILGKKGVHTAIVSDHPELPSKYLLLSAQLAVKNGMSPKAALKSITVNAAETLNIGSFLGKISPNYNAEILIFDKSPINFTSKITNIFIGLENYTKH